MTISRSAALSQAIVLGLTMLFASGCSGPTAGDKSAEKPGASSVSSSAMSEDDDDAGEFGSGTLSFQLQPDAAITMPVTFCAGHGTILTIAGKEGEAQVDMRLIELPALRDGKSLKEIAEVGYRFTGTDEGRDFEEFWQTRSIEEAIHDGDITSARGKMYGLRSYSKGNGMGTTPESIGERDFTLKATCSAPE